MGSKAMDERTDGAGDLASGVGATATMVAAARAVATRRVKPLITDRFAAPLVQAVGIDFFIRFATGDLDSADIDGPQSQAMQRLVDVMAVRTRYFDSFLAEAAIAGIRQVVILAAGLDARAYRLSWPADTTIFEIDRPGVTEFKTATLNALEAKPNAKHWVVASDLRQDWHTDLRRTGFQTDSATAWIAEGLLGYLPAPARDQLLNQITALSAPRSRLAVDVVPNLSPAEQDHFQKRIQSLIERWQAHGFNVDMTAGMVYLDDHHDVDEYLTALGWETTTATTSELFLGSEIDPVDEHDDDRAPFAVARYVSAVYSP
jgi:methyltransferase (TIGR00027 family)